MLSTLEHEPELIAAIGLITVRWSNLEVQLANALDIIMLQSTAGPRIYYSLNNFTQRIDVVQAAIQASLADQRHIAIANALFEKIRRIWKTRNYLIHSRYVYVAKYDSGSQWIRTTIAKDGIHPAARQEPTIRALVHLPDGTVQDSDKEEIIERGFAYEKHGRAGTSEFVMVNEGTFTSHANQVAKRSRQILCFTQAIQRGRAPIVFSQSALHATSWKKSQ